MCIYNGRIFFLMEKYMQYWKIINATARVCILVFGNKIMEGFQKYCLKLLKQ